MKSDETSSMGTGASLDSQVLHDIEPEDEEILQEGETEKSKQARVRKVRAKSTISLETGLQLEGTENFSSQGRPLTIKEKQALKRAQQQASAAKPFLPNILESEELVIPSVSVPATAKSLSIKQKQELKRAAQGATSPALLSSNPPNLQSESNEQ
jgi:hypothetical protein